MPKAQSPKPVAESPSLVNRSDHYSYVVYADAGMAERFDRRRFGGPIGALLLEEQERVLGDFLGELEDCHIIDVGTGTGRAALALARRGAHVTGVDASAEMLETARKRAGEAGVKVIFDRDDAHALHFPSRAFDHAVSLRVLMHAPDWRRCLGELCRLARHRVVVDFPAVGSVAAVQAVTRRIQAACAERRSWFDKAHHQRGRSADRQVEAYRVFRLSTITHEFEHHGFRVSRVHRQFVLPIALHKLIGSRRFTVAVEGGLAAVGILQLVGSPVTIVAERCESS